MAETETGASMERTVRTCVGCRRADGPRFLVRLAVGPIAPFVAPDVSGRARGRGGRSVWLHPRRDCAIRATRGGLSRSLRRDVSIGAEALIADIRAGYERRMEALLLAALRRRKVTIGTDATREALVDGELSLLVVAHDAAGRRDEFVAAAARLERHLLFFSTKAALGRLFSRDEVAVIGVLEPGIAQELVESGERLLGLSEAE